MKKTCIIVLGMHRSGTSALTGVLNLLDIYLGNNLMEKSKDNPKGYFENNRIVNINNKLLQQIGSAWDDIFFNESKIIKSIDLSSLKAILIEEFQNQTLIAIKDPRIVFLFPYYEQILKEIGFDIKVIIPYRNPLEVAKSLQKRDGMSLEKGMLLWAYHLLLAEKFSREFKRVFIEFDEIINDTKNTIKKISNNLELSLLPIYMKCQKNIETFLEPSLKHHNIGKQVINKLPRPIQDLWFLLQESNIVENKFDELYINIFDLQKLFYNKDLLNKINKPIDNIMKMKGSVVFEEQNHNNPLLKYDHRKIASEEKKIVIYFADPFDNDKFRDLTLGLLAPFARLNEYEIVNAVEIQNSKVVFRRDEISTCVMCVVFDRGAIFSQWIDKIKRAGIPIVFYIFTNIWKVPYKHANYERSLAWKEHYDHVINNAEKILVSNEYLTKYVPKESTVMIPFAEPRLWDDKIQREGRSKDKTVVATFVEPNNLENLKLIIEPIKKLQKKYSDDVIFRIYAINCKAYDLAGLDFMDVQIALNPIENYLDYVKFIRTKDIDIALVPLLDEEYQIASTVPLKYFENALSKVPGIYSNTGLYARTVKNMQTGILCPNSTDEWIRAISLLIENLELRESIAKKSNEFVRTNFNIISHLQKWEEFLGATIKEVQTPYDLDEIFLKQLSRYDVDSIEIYSQYKAIKALQEYDAYLWQLQAQRWKHLPEFTVFIQIDSIEKEIIDCLANTLESLEKQIYPNWKCFIVSPFESINPLFEEHAQLEWIQTQEYIFDVINHLTEDLQNTFVWCIHVGDQYDSQAFARVCDYYNNNPDIKIFYGDHDIVDKEGICNYPKFKPDFNLEMLRAYNYIERACCVHIDLLHQLNGFDTALKEAEFFDLFLRFTDITDNENAIGHIQEILLTQFDDGNEEIRQIQAIAEKVSLVRHFQRRNIVAEVVEGELGTRRILYHHDEKPIVSILIPTKNQFNYIKPCIESIEEKTAYKNYEIIIVDTGSDEKEAVEFLKSLQDHEHVKVIQYTKPFNYSTVNNVAAEHAKGEYFLLLNNDTEVLHENWLDVMMSHAQRNDVGIVGARLLFKKGTIQHAGVIVGMSGVADHPFSGLPPEDEGYMKRLHIDQEYSAVTAAALLVKKEAFEKVGGLNDSDYQVNFSDVDFCLKIREAGYKVIWTPHATLLHHGSVTQKDIDPEKIKARDKVFKNDKYAFIKLWKQWIEHDPAYNVNFDIFSAEFNIRLSALPHWDPSQKSDLPKVFGMARNFDGGGLYRIIQPLKGLEEGGYIQSTITYKNHQPMYVQYTRPDVIVYQTPLHDNQIEFLKFMKKFFPQVQLVYEIDDLLTNIPIDNAAFHHQYKDTHQRLQRAMSYCDKVVVSTQPLKDAFGKYHDDIRVIPNMLSWKIWGGLESLRKQGKKLRVGWAGSLFHKGDLSIIKQLVLDFRDEVEWVFMGMVPEGLEEIVEYHKPVSLEKYPQALAKLNLDLALVPLEDNPFNEAKSNLRLLEFGILGWPVIATDIYPYREAPIVRVKNRYKAWKKAFEEAIAYPDELPKKGDMLKQWVEDNFILEKNLGKLYELYIKK